jgi:CRISPR-associated protein Cas2
MVKFFTVIAYDISSGKKRKEVSKLLDQYGQRANKSVYECFVTKSQIKEIKKEIKQLINSKSDSVLFYSLCKSCVEKKEYVGKVGFEVPEVRIV